MALEYGFTDKEKQNYYQTRSEEHTSELQSNSDIVCRLLIEKKELSTSVARRAHFARMLAVTKTLGSSPERHP